MYIQLRVKPPHEHFQIYIKRKNLKKNNKKHGFGGSSLFSLTLQHPSQTILYYSHIKKSHFLQKTIVLFSFLKIRPGQGISDIVINVQTLLSLDGITALFLRTLVGLGSIL